MKVSLLFPPAWTPTMPHLALPALTAYLRVRGIEVTQRDLNVEAYDFLLSRPVLHMAQTGVARRLRLLSHSRRSNPLDQAEFEYLQQVVPGSRDLVHDIELAKQILRGPAFYEPDENLGAVLTVVDALQIASAPYFPSILTWDGYETLQGPDSTHGVLGAIADVERNVFVDFYRQKVIPRLSREGPDLVGISISTVHQVVPALTLAAMIKSFDRDLHIVVGGKMVTCWRDELPRNDDMFAFFDSAIVFEGGRALAELSERLADGRSLEGVPNLIYREGDEIRVNEAGEGEDMDALPAPDFGGFPMDKYLAPEIVLPIEAARGCYWRQCAFCNLGYGQSLTYRPRRPERVVEDIAALQERYGAHSFFFVDEAVSSHTLAALADSISDKGINVRWTACTRFEESLESALLQKISGAGCKMLMHGLESGSQRVLDQMGKGTDLSTVSRVLRQGADAGIWNHVFVFFGFPGETRDDAEATVRFVQEHLPAIHSVAGGTFILEKHSRVYEDPQTYGVSRILRDPDADLAFQYDYEVATGQTAADAKDSLSRLRDMLDERRPPRVLFYDVYNLLYASHFEDPSDLFAPAEPA